MPLASTGTISLSQIQTEFGGTNPISIAEYYTNSGTGFTSGIAGLPATGTTISMSAFRGKQKTAFTTTTLASGAVMATYTTTVAHIDEIPYSSFSSLTGAAFYLKYTISTSAGAQQIVVSCRNSTRISRIAQSCFSLNGSTLTFGTPQRYNWFVNDDNDTLFMDGTGSAGYISRNQQNTLYDIGTGFGKFSLTNSVFSFDAGNNQPQGYPGSGTFTSATVVAFPATSRTLYFTATNYIINGLTAQTWNSTVTTFMSGLTIANSLTTVSDGVNSVLVIRHSTSSSTGMYLTFNLTTGVMITATSVSFVDTYTRYNETEEDAIGNQLFSIDGSISYYRNLNFYYSSRTVNTWSFLDGVTTGNTVTSVGSVDTATGMDILTSIDAGDGYAYFVDWGHDDGGLFNFGNDSALGYTKTNIFKIPSDFTGVSPTRVAFPSPIVNANRTSVNVTSLPSNSLSSVKTDDATFTFALNRDVIPFNMAGTSVTNIIVSSNCFIQFDSSNRFNYADADRYAYQISYEYLNSAIGNHLRIVCWHGYKYGASDEYNTDLRFEIKFYRDSTYQYIEAKANDTMRYSGNTAAPTNNTNFQGITLPELTSGTSYVLRSDLLGTNWTLISPAYINA